MADSNAAAEPATKGPDLGEADRSQVANDKELPINQGASAAVKVPIASDATVTPNVEPLEGNSEPNSETITLSDADVAQTSEATPEQLAGQIESLTGEIQALEAKIERMTGNVSPAKEASSPAAEEPTAKNEPVEPAKEAIADDQEIKVEKTESALPTNKTIATSPINDIYAKIQKEQDDISSGVSSQTAETQAKTADSSLVGTSGEVLTVVGVILFFILLASPLYTSFLGDDFKTLLKSVGWPTTLGCLLIGFILSLFTKGKLGSKILTLIVLLLAVVMVLGIFDRSSLLGPLGSMFDSVFSYYQ